MDSSAFLKEFKRLKASLEQQQNAAGTSDEKTTLNKEMVDLKEKIDNINIEVYKKETGQYDTNPTSFLESMKFLVFGDKKDKRRTEIDSTEEYILPRLKIKLNSLERSHAESLVNNGLKNKQDSTFAANQIEVLQTPLISAPTYSELPANLFFSSYTVQEIEESQNRSMDTPYFSKTTSDRLSIDPNLFMHAQSRPLLPPTRSYEITAEAENKELVKHLANELRAFSATKNKTTKNKTTNREVTEEIEKVDDLTAKVNTGGKVHRTVNLNISKLIGEMNNHFTDREFSEEELADISIKGLLRGLNGATRLVEQ